MTIRDIKDITSFKWGTIVDTGPIQVRLDGDESPLSAVPDSLIDPKLLTVGDRVRVELSLRKAVIHGRSNGEPDTGWEDLTSYVVSPFAGGSLQGRIIGNEVEVRGSLTGSTGQTAGSVDIAGPLPSKYWPTTRIGFGVAYNAGYAMPAFVRTDGTVGLGRAVAAVASSIQVTIRYFIG